MNLKEWWKWIRELHFSKKWFVILILIRPLVDNFYDLKDISALTSPLYIVGILTPFFILFSALSPSMPRSTSSFIDIPIFIWMLFLFFNCFVYYTTALSVVALGEVIKYITPLLLMLYSKRFIQSKRDLDGILTTFLIACSFPLGLLIWESIFNPIAVEYVSEGRGGGARIRGGYADIMNYAIYIIGFFIIGGYYFLCSVYRKREGGIKISVAWLAAILVLTFFGLTQIKHVSTYSVFFAILLYLIIHNLRNAQGIAFIGGLMLIVLPFFAKQIYVSQIDPLIHKEILVAEGETASEGALNGRMSRWEKYFAIWEQMPTINHFIGISSANFKETDIMIGGGMHSDYVRNLFLCGIIGMLFYVLFNAGILATYFQFQLPEKFLILSTVTAMLLWSVSTVPELYAPLLYFVYPIYAYAILPKQKMYSEK